MGTITEWAVRIVKEDHVRVTPYPDEAQARMTAAACRRAGMEAVLVSRVVTEWQEETC